MSDGNKDPKNKAPALWRAVFEAPPPQRKDEFLDRLQRQEADGAVGEDHAAYAGGEILSFMLVQAGYIRKRIYFVTFMILAAAAVIVMRGGQYGLDQIAAMMPFAAMCLVTENCRSKIYGMAEMELAARFSLKSVVAARCGAIGFLHLFLLCVLILVVRHGRLAPVFEAAVYLLAPYLISCMAQTAAARRLRGTETAAVCLGVSAAVSLFYIMLKQLLYHLYGGYQIVLWTALAVWMIYRVARQYSDLMHHAQEWIAQER